MSKVMMTIVGLFLVTNIPRVSLLLHEAATIPSILKCIDRSCRYFVSNKVWLVDSIIRVLILMNSTLNFLVYCLGGPQYLS